MNVKYIVVHCSDSPDDRDFNAADIHNWHIQRGWAGIGYHYVLPRTGIVETGRPLYWQGAHVAGHNHESIGICLVGRHKFTDLQMDGLHYLLYYLIEKFPKAEVLGHCDLKPKKTCPNFNVARWWEANRSKKPYERA